MSSEEEIKNIAKKTLEIEASSITGLLKYINDDFVKTIQLILTSKGRVVITGIGKSANICQKIVATLNSTGTPSIFMHAADAIHGDLGNVLKDDVVICISKSGDTPEIKSLVPLVKSFGNSLIAITGNPTSFLGKQSDYVLNTYVEKEACPNNLAPTSSTTAQLAMGDALAVCLLESRGFDSSDFAKFHPGGALGKKLTLKVGDLYPNNEKPEVAPNSSIKDVIVEISSKRLGITAVIENNNILGIVTDGDLRRMLENSSDFDGLTAKDIMSIAPKTIGENEMATTALTQMQNNNITQLIVADGNTYLGVIHLHDLLKEGIA
ncbi:MAG: KpsF/GutQ family sugar-phosphate isomerase [Flavobacteriales bacterium]|nr:KpsF/GutQ family sugar-phosphate isomerase [Flavobacteriales bacterium]